MTLSASTSTEVTCSSMAHPTDFVELTSDAHAERGWQEGCCSVSRMPPSRCSRRTSGGPLEPHAVTRMFQRRLVKAGIKHRRFHDLRHTCATLLLAQGVPIRVVMETLGHTQIATTADIYSHVLPTMMEEAAAWMDAVLG